MASIQDAASIFPNASFKGATNLPNDLILRLKRCIGAVNTRAIVKVETLSPADVSNRHAFCGLHIVGGSTNIDVLFSDTRSWCEPHRPV